MQHSLMPDRVSWWRCHSLNKINVSHLPTISALTRLDPTSAWTTSMHDMESAIVTYRMQHPWGFGMKTLKASRCIPPKTEHLLECVL